MEKSTYYRAMSYEEALDCISKGFIPSNKNWAGFHNTRNKFGKRAINRVTGWVAEGKGPFGSYDILVSYNAPPGDFERNNFESEVYENKMPIPLVMVSVESLSGRISQDKVMGLKLGERVIKLLGEQNGRGM